MAVRPEVLIKEGQEYYDEEIRTTDMEICQENNYLVLYKISK